MRRKQKIAGYKEVGCSFRHAFPSYDVYLICMEIGCKPATAWGVVTWMVLVLFLYIFLFCFFNTYYFWGFGVHQKFMAFHGWQIAILGSKINDMDKRITSLNKEIEETWRKYRNIFYIVKFSIIPVRGFPHHNKKRLD